jgi:ribonuclease HI
MLDFKRYSCGSLPPHATRSWDAQPAPRLRPGQLFEDPLKVLVLSGRQNLTTRQGGWAVSLRWQGSDETETYSGAEAATNHIRMELTALLEALKRDLLMSRICVVASSQYLIGGLRALKKWKGNGWMTNAGTPVKHQDLWGMIDELAHLRHFEDGSGQDPAELSRVSKLALQQAGMVLVPQPTSGDMFEI